MKQRRVMVLVALAWVLLVPLPAQSEDDGGVAEFDGSVEFLNESMDLELLAAMCTRNGNENIPDLER